jgi:hypothetical protein
LRAAACRFSIWVGMFALVASDHRLAMRLPLPSKLSWVLCPAAIPKSIVQSDAAPEDVGSRLPLESA